MILADQSKKLYGHSHRENLITDYKLLKVEGSLVQIQVQLAFPHLISSEVSDNIQVKILDPLALKSIDFAKLSPERTIYLSEIPL